MSQPARQTVIDQWTGRHATALQAALRMSQDEMAALIGVAKRTIASWSERPEIIIRPELQRALDTAYSRADEPAKLRFARQLKAEDDAEVAAAGNAVALTIAIAVVINETNVLLVCRRDADPNGITWQFPAGIVKPGATPATVAIRETLAETGVHCSVRDELGSRIHPLSGVSASYFLCDYLAGEVENRDEIENTSALWAPTEDVTRFIPKQRIYAPVLRALEGSAISEPTTEDRPAIAAAVIIKDGEVLLVRRRVKEGQLSWQFPAGQVEPGETGDQAAVRETQEETGLTVRATGSLGERVHPNTGRTMLYTACDVVAGTAYVADEEELAEVAWCNRATLTAHVPYPFFAPVQEHLDANLR